MLKSGILPDGDFIGGLMAEVVENGTSHLSDSELRAIAAYLKAMPSIRNKVARRSSGNGAGGD